MSLNREELEEVIEATVSRSVPVAVQHTLEGLGVDVTHPLEVQRDQQFLRSARTFFGAVLTRVLMALVFAALAAAGVSFAARAFGG